MQASGLGVQGLGAGQGDRHTPRDALGLLALSWLMVRGAALVEQASPQDTPHLLLTGACGAHRPNREAAYLSLAHMWRSPGHWLFPRAELSLSLQGPTSKKKGEAHRVGRGEI